MSEVNRRTVEAFVVVLREEAKRQKIAVDATDKALRGIKFASADEAVEKAMLLGIDAGTVRGLTQAADIIETWLATYSPKQQEGN